MKWAIATNELPKKLDSLSKESFQFLQIEKHGKKAEMKSSIEKLNNFIELKNIKFQESNKEKMEDGESEVREMVRKSIIQMKHEVDQEVILYYISYFIVMENYSDNLCDYFYFIDINIKNLVVINLF